MRQRLSEHANGTTGTTYHALHQLLHAVAGEVGEYVLLHVSSGAVRELREAAAAL